MRGKFITVEGIDGAGKSTHLPAIVRLLESRGLCVTQTREPGGTPLGERLRALMLEGGEPLHAETEVLLMFGARREHLERVILPALVAGRWVVCDRFTDATYAYQSGGSGIEEARIEALESWVQHGMQPDLTLLFDVVPEVGRARRGSVKHADRFEREADDFYRRVRDAYLRRAKQFPSRIRVVDAGRSSADVAVDVERIVREFCG